MAAAKAYFEDDIDRILERSSRTVVHNTGGECKDGVLGTFSKATFTPARQMEVLQTCLCVCDCGCGCVFFSVRVLPLCDLCVTGTLVHFAVLRRPQIENDADFWKKLFPHLRHAPDPNLLVEPRVRVQTQRFGVKDLDDSEEEKEMSEYEHEEAAAGEYPAISVGATNVSRVFHIVLC